MSNTPTFVARWESEGGKYFAELYADQSGYSYIGKNNGGSLGKITEAEAIAWMEERVQPFPLSRNGSYFHPGKRPMTRVVKTED